MRRITLGVTIFAALLLAALFLYVGPAHADTARGWILDQGAPTYTDDPNSISCTFGCNAGTTPVAGTPVDIMCRTEQGYLKVAYPGQPRSVWVFAADVHAFGKPAACGALD